MITTNYTKIWLVFNANTLDFFKWKSPNFGVIILQNSSIYLDRVNHWKIFYYKGVEPLKNQTGVSKSWIQYLRLLSQGFTKAYHNKVQAWLIMNIHDHRHIIELKSSYLFIANDSPGLWCFLLQPIYYKPNKSLLKKISRNVHILDLVTSLQNNFLRNTWTLLNVL